MPRSHPRPRESNSVESRRGDQRDPSGMAAPHDPAGRRSAALRPHGFPGREGERAGGEPLHSSSPRPLVARPGSEGAKEGRWHRLAVESLKQSRRAFLMELGEPQGLEAFLSGAPGGGQRCGWPIPPERIRPGRKRKTGPGTVTLVVGPEGGFSPRNWSSSIPPGPCGAPGGPPPEGGNRCPKR